MAPKTSKISHQESQIDMADKFQNLHEKAVLFGLKPSDFLNLSSLRRIREDKPSISKRRTFFVIALCFVLLNQALEYPVNIFNILLILFGGPLAREVECIVILSETIDIALRPPITDCSFCKNVTDIPKLSNISTNYFYETFSKRKHPVVIVDAMEKWNAKKKFQYKFLKNIYLQYGSNSLDLKSDTGLFLTFQGEFENLYNVFDRVDEETMMLDGKYPWYIGWADEDSVTKTILRQYYGVPYFLKNMRRINMPWIFMGSPGYGATNHIDSVEFPSWQGQIRGKKFWTLQPPPECYFECAAISLDVTVNEGEMSMYRRGIYDKLTDSCYRDEYVVPPNSKHWRHHQHFYRSGIQGELNTLPGYPHAQLLKANGL